MKKAIITSAIGAAFLFSGAAMADGKGTFDTVCFACHATGVAGAPKVGDKANWAPRIAQGMDVLKQHANQGFQGKSGVMPAKGGRVDLADDVIGAAVEYMVSQSQ
jgi:cytochrome c5